MLSYHNDPKVKEKYVNRIKAHKAADNLIQGMGWSKGKGCAIGCTLENYNHAQYPIELGIPIHLALLEDKIFEGLPKNIAMEWPQRFLEAVPVGADLEMVWPKFVLWVLQEVIQYAKPDGKKTIDKVINLYEKWIEGNKPSLEDFKQARAAASAAAAAYFAVAAAYAAACAAAAADAAAADADAAAYAAAVAADAAYFAVAAAYAAACAAAAADAAAAVVALKARHNFWIKASNKLIELIEECK